MVSPVPPLPGLCSSPLVERSTALRSPVLPMRLLPLSPLDVSLTMVPAHLIHPALLLLSLVPVPARVLTTRMIWVGLLSKKGRDVSDVFS